MRPFAVNQFVNCVRIVGKRTSFLSSSTGLSLRYFSTNFDARRATPREIRLKLEEPYKEQMARLTSMRIPWDDHVEFKYIETEVNQLSSLERDVLCRLWLSHRSFGSDNHIAHAAVCAGTNMIACALAGLPLREYGRVHNVLDLENNFLKRPYTGRGEGNTLPDRFSGEINELYGSVWEQYAQAHFGISIEASKSSIITIKIAQSAKPTIGGKLPAVKNTPQVADARGVIPGIPLDSPATHHNIYSIEDLDDVIKQLKSLNPHNKISVKIVAQDGVVETAKGVAKAGADIIELSFAGGGTGSTTEHNRREYGRGFTRRNDENIINEVHQALINEGFRDKVHVYVDGLMRTPQDVVTALASGADIVGFGTAVMIVGQGCIKADDCHTGGCPVGIQTMDPDLVAKFKGSPSRVANYLISLAKSSGQIITDRRLNLLADVIGNGELLEFSRPNQPVGKRLLQSRPRIHSFEAGMISRLLSGEKEFVVRGKDISNVDHNFLVPFSAVLHKRSQLGQLQVSHVLVDGHSFPGSGFSAFAPAGLFVDAPGVVTDARLFENGRGRIIAHSAGDAAMMGVNEGSTTMLHSAAQRYGVLAKGGTHVVNDIGKFGLNYVFGGSWVILGSIGPGFGAAFRNGDIYISNNIDQSLFHDDIKGLEPLPITDRHLELIWPTVQRQQQHFPHGGGLSQDQFMESYVRYNPIAQQLMA
ncbi:hypothetical protein DID76_03585 [Candidatus Marinamargulisbacteria bacterium SCGC AG-414-C22]|nr:hypothetical protein DID76_03585 [Candidatus Marinamargulisbacteria bacterium SCGC AG-414-C22]